MQTSAHICSLPIIVFWTPLQLDSPQGSSSLTSMLQVAATAWAIHSMHDINTFLQICEHGSRMTPPLSDESFLILYESRVKFLLSREAEEPDRW